MGFFICGDGERIACFRGLERTHQLGEGDRRSSRTWLPARRPFSADCIAFTDMIGQQDIATWSLPLLACCPQAFDKDVEACYQREMGSSARLARTDAYMRAHTLAHKELVDPTSRHVFERARPQLQPG